MLSQQISLDQFIALNQEIVALSEAGIPLEKGLSQAATQMQGKMQVLTARLADSLEAGATLDQAIATQDEHLPEVYQSFVKVGLRSGNLTQALELLSEITSKTTTIRQAILLSLLYPLVLFIITWQILIFAFSDLLPEYEWVGTQSHKLFSSWHHQVLGSWGGANLFPIIVLMIGLICWFYTNPIRIRSKFRPISYEKIPIIGYVYRLSAYACFTDLLRLQLKNQIPLDQALPLAANATGLSALQATCDHASDDLRKGISPTNLPPMIQLAMSSSHTPEQTEDALRLVANAYRHQVNSTIQNYSTFMPIVALGTAGGAIVLVFSLILLYPYIESLKTMSHWY